MFKDFLEGKKRTFTQKDAVEFLEGDTLERLKEKIESRGFKLKIEDNEVDIRIESKVVDNNKVYHIKHGWNNYNLMILDDARKNIIIFSHELFQVLTNIVYIYHDEFAPSIVKEIEGYKVYIVEEQIQELNNKMDQLEKHILESEKDRIYSDFELIKEEESYTNSRIRDYFKTYFVEGKENIYDRIIKNYEVGDIEIAYKYALDSETFMSSIKDIIYKKMFDLDRFKRDKLTSAYMYHEINRMLEEGTNERKLLLAREVYKALKLGGKTVNIITKDDKQIKTEPRICSYNCYDEIGSHGKYVKTDNVKKITYSRNSLFDVEEFNKLYDEVAVD